MYHSWFCDVLSAALLLLYCCFTAAAYTDWRCVSQLVLRLRCSQEVVWHQRRQVRNKLLLSCCFTAAFVLLLSCCFTAALLLLTAALLQAPDCRRARCHGRQRPGTQFTCFTGTKVQILALKATQELFYWYKSTNTDASCCAPPSTSRLARTKVQILTELLLQKYKY